MGLNYKDVHIGKHIKEISKVKKLSMSRACAFLKCSTMEIEEMYNLRSMDSDMLLKWSKLLDYNFFMFYHAHLQLYKPSAATAQVTQKEDEDLKDTYSFKKNIYSPEIIDHILNKLDKKILTVKDIITRYNIPRTTIYRWIKKRDLSKSNHIKEEPVLVGKTLSKKKIKYKSLYLDFIDDTEFESHIDKSFLKESVMKIDEITSREIYKLNTLIREYSKSEYTWIQYQQLKSYDKDHILRVLKEQKEYDLSNSEISRKYNMSRNTIARWKRIFNKTS